MNRSGCLGSFCQILEGGPPIGLGSFRQICPSSATILQFKPDFRVKTTQPKAFRPLSILRQASEPLTVAADCRVTTIKVQLAREAETGF